MPRSHSRIRASTVRCRVVFITHSQGCLIVIHFPVVLTGLQPKSQVTACLLIVLSSCGRSGFNATNPGTDSHDAARSLDASNNPDATVAPMPGTPHLSWGIPIMANRCSPISVYVAHADENVPATSARLQDMGGGMFYADDRCTLPISIVDLAADQQAALVFYRNPTPQISEIQATTDTGTHSFYMPVSRYLMGNPGFWHTCVVLATGMAKCWGLNNNGQLGDGTTTLSLVPVNVTSSEGLQWATAGLQHTCFVTDSGVKCVGSGGSGEIGNGDDRAQSALTAAVGLDGATSLDANFHFQHNCAVRANAEVACWGAGISGQLGNGEATSSNVPVTAVGITSATSTVTGYFHSCALLRDGTVWCWGTHSGQQLIGDGLVDMSAVPMQVPGLARVVQLAAGHSGTCAVVQDGRLFCWVVPISVNSPRSTRLAMQ